MNNVEENLHIVQKCCLEIVREIDRICRRHNIEYSLTAGSVIGYHLYRGFIPWDDDIDLMMTRENYDRFLEVCNKELPERYSLNNYENGLDKTILFSKIVDNQTTVVEKKWDGTETISGVFVDISVFDRFPKGTLSRCHLRFMSKLIQFSRQRVYEKNKSLKAIIRNSGLLVLRPFSSSIYRYAMIQIKKERSSEYDYAELLFGLTIPYKRRLFEEYIDVKFDEVSLMLVKDYMCYLETRYGKREFYKQRQTGDAPHHIIYVDCEMPYEKYLLQKGLSK